VESIIGLVCSGLCCLLFVAAAGGAIFALTRKKEPGDGDAGDDGNGGDDMSLPSMDQAPKTVPMAASSGAAVASAGAPSAGPTSPKAVAAPSGAASPSSTPSAGRAPAPMAPAPTADAPTTRPSAPRPLQAGSTGRGVPDPGSTIPGADPRDFAVAPTRLGDSMPPRPPTGLSAITPINPTQIPDDFPDDVPDDATTLMQRKPRIE
jgi:hypothetical protein